VSKNLLYYGLQRSGTNYLHELLIQKFNVRLLNSDEDRAKTIQKHFRLYDDKTIIPEPKYHNNLTITTFHQFLELSALDRKIDGVIVISKDPYSWYLSYCKWAKICQWPKVNHHYVEEYNLFYSKWMDLSKEDGRIIFIRYIDLLTEKNRTLKRIKEQFQLSANLSLKGLKSIIKSTSLVPQSEAFTKSKNDYYVHQEYLQKLSIEEIQTINQKLSDELMSFLGYKKANS
jgi:hypothetical protein